MSDRPKRTRRERLIAVLAVLLALLMLLPMITMILSYFPVAGASQSVGSIQTQIDTLKNKNKSLASQKADLKKQLQSIQADKSRAQEKKNLLEQQINVLLDEIENLEEQLTQYDLLIAEKERQVADNEASEEAQFDLFVRQCRAMEEEGTVSFWSILFQANSYTDLLDRINMVNDIAAYNQQVCDQLVAAREALQAAREELVAAQDETRIAKEETEAAKQELRDQEAEVDKLIAEIKADEKATQDAINQLDADAAAMDAAIARKEKELQAAIEAEKNRYQFDPGTGFYWPLPKERVSVTSFFGPRYDPITGNRSNHSGTDIGAYTGTDIYAAHGGVVITSAYHSSYGNYVVISRGDGITTLYAHMSKRLVKEGQTVSQGQRIGLVGNTGRSTASHLHFEVRVNGVRQDALKYYPNVKWVNNTGYPYS